MSPCRRNLFLTRVLRDRFRTYVSVEHGGAICRKVFLPFRKVLDAPENFVKTGVGAEVGPPESYIGDA